MVKKRLLWVSDAPSNPHVGQSRVARECLERLKKEYEVAVAGFHHPKLCNTETVHNDYTVYNIVRGNTELIKGAIEKFKPDVVVLSHDVFEFPRAQSLANQFPNVKFVGYFTVDGEPIDHRWAPVFESCHALWSPTRYGKRVINDRLFYLDVEVIPYGIDHSTFHTANQPEIQAIKKASRIPIDGSFTAMFVGHNHGRKNLSAAMQGWKQFAEDKTDVAFIVITHTRQTKYGEWGNLPLDYDLGEFRSATSYVVDAVVDDATLAAYLKVANVLLFPTIGEGFGLPILEAMGCGCVPMVTDFSGHTDFCNEDNSYMLPGVPMYANVWMSQRYIVDHAVIEENLNKAYNHWKNDKSVLHKKRQNAAIMSKDYTWDKTGDMMLESLENLLSDTRRERVNKVYFV